jgi:hypothetical protein
METKLLENNVVPLLKWLPPRRPGFASGQHVGFVVDKAAPREVFSQYFDSPANHSTNFSITIITGDWHNKSLVAAMPSGPN